MTDYIYKEIESIISVDKNIFNKSYINYIKEVNEFIIDRINNTRFI